MFKTVLFMRFIELALEEVSPVVTLPAPPPSPPSAPFPAAAPPLLPFPEEGLFDALLATFCVGGVVVVLLPEFALASVSRRENGANEGRVT